LCYIDARDVMDRLDDVLGIENWTDDYEAGAAGGVLCRLTLTIDGRQVTKTDAAENTDIEEVKGGISDAFKRAAVKFGIGRYLYSAGTTWAEIGERSASSPNRHSGKDGKVFYWGPPAAAYYALGYTKSEVDALPYYTPGTKQAPRRKAARPASDVIGSIVGMVDPAAVGAVVGEMRDPPELVKRFADAKIGLLKAKSRDEVATIYRAFKTEYLDSLDDDGDHEAARLMWDQAARLAAEKLGGEK